MKQGDGEANLSHHAECVRLVRSLAAYNRATALVGWSGERDASTFWPPPVDASESLPFVSYSGPLGELKSLLMYGQSANAHEVSSSDEQPLPEGPMDFFGSSVTSQLVEGREAVTRVASELGGLGYAYALTIAGALDAEVETLERHGLEDAYHDSLEVTYIRLCGFWDRAAQLLAYVFFNVREFDRDVFATVLQRIHTNFAVYDDGLRNLPAWVDLWAYGAQEGGETGYQWLNSRRNQFVHSVAYDRRYDHDPKFLPWFGDSIGRRIAHRVRPEPPLEELARVANHVRAVRAKGHSVVEMCLYATQTMRLQPWRSLSDFGE